MNTSQVNPQNVGQTVAKLGLNYINSSLPNATVQPQTQVQKATTTPNINTNYQSQIQKQINDAYKQQIDFLNNQSSNLQTQLPDYLQTVASPFEQQIPQLQSQLETQKQQAATDIQNTQQAEQQNIAAARRSGAEQTQRAVQQFGGVGGSSAAEAAGAVIGQQQLRNQGQAMQQSQMAQQNIQNQLRAIQSDYNANVSKLALQKEQALSQARLDFNKQLQAIETAKASAGQTKSSQTIQALQNFAAARSQIEQQAQTFQNNLALMRESAALSAAQTAASQKYQTPVGATSKMDFGRLNSEQVKSTINAITQNGSITDPQSLAVYGVRPVGNNLYADSTGGIYDTDGNFVGGTPAQQIFGQKNWTDYL